MSKHTPGPWIANSGMIFAGQMRVCDIRGWGHLTGIGGLNLPDAQAIAIQDANAALIAAAPDLLEAAKEVWKAYGGDSNGIHQRLQAAINKAEGQS